MNATYPNSPGFKTVAMETSEQAASETKSRAATLRDKCLSELEFNQSTPDEMATRLNENILSIRPRFSELNKMGKIEATELRRKNASGKSAVVWKVAKQQPQREFTDW